MTLDRGRRARAGLSALVLAVVLEMVGVAREARADETQLLVFEAASLKDAFSKLAHRFEKDHPGVRVVPNAAGTQELRAQVEHGAAADVFASADHKHMDALAAEGLVVAPGVFTCNEPVVIVRKGMSPAIRSWADLPRAERIVVGTPEVPIGAYTLQILQKATRTQGADFPRRVQAKVASRELNVRQILAKVALGEADAGIVYRSDAASAAGKVQVVTIPPESNVSAEYPIAVMKKAPSPALARQWVDLVKSPVGAQILGESGFIPCPRR
ncbi:MAG TPA: molybdate ABC transporter substrate-binding protein [Polyangia bacterium]